MGCPAGSLGVIWWLEHWEVPELHLLRSFVRHPLILWSLFPLERPHTKCCPPRWCFWLPAGEKFHTSKGASHLSSCSSSYFLRSSTLCCSLTVLSTHSLSLLGPLPSRRHFGCPWFFFQSAPKPSSKPYSSFSYICQPSMAVAPP